ncbi:hypothetical protein TNCV_3018111 [Trichonephila clavipes]|nr:hypothetical protein TNCV_3018111 [Trichonephila clavipes]
MWHACHRWPTSALNRPLLSNTAKVSRGLPQTKKCGKESMKQKSLGTSGLDNFLRWRAVDRFEVDQSQVEVARGLQVFRNSVEKFNTLENPNSPGTICIRMRNTTPWRATNPVVWDKLLLEKEKDAISSNYYSRSNAKDTHIMDSVRELLNPLLRT